MAWHRHNFADICRPTANSIMKLKPKKKSPVIQNCMFDKTEQCNKQTVMSSTNWCDVITTEWLFNDAVSTVALYSVMISNGDRERILKETVVACFPALVWRDWGKSREICDKAEISSRYNFLNTVPVLYRCTFFLDGETYTFLLSYRIRQLDACTGLLILFFILRLSFRL
jgi:hypothetical protein